MFGVFYKLGVFHIINIEAYDHILFLLVLVGVYSLNRWKQILALVTAFTIGHTTSLALSTLNIVSLNPQTVEVLIAFTILISATEDLFFKEEKDTNPFILKYWIKYGIALVFGLIHGLGFSTTLKSLILDSDNIAVPILGFNFGVETGQIIVVFIILLFTFILYKFLKVNQIKFARLTGIIGIIGSLIMIYTRI